MSNNDHLQFNPIDWQGFYPPYYAYEMKKRALIFHSAKKSKTLQQKIKKECSNDIVKFISTFAFVLDPRLISLGKPALLPFVPFQKQIEFLEWQENLVATGESGVVKKSRDCGISLLCLLVLLHSWLFKRDFTGGIFSAKITMVDRLSDPTSLFGKLRGIVEHIPDWMMPSDYTNNFARLTNNDNGSAILGYSGTENAARGSRLLLAFIDECAFIPGMANVNSSLSQVCNTRIMVSTPWGKNNFFAQEWFRDGSNRFEFLWKNDPRKSKEWYANITQKLDKATVAREIDASFEESSDRSIIQSVWLSKCRQQFDQVYNSRYPIVTSGVDVAYTGKNKTIYTLLIAGCIALRQIEIPETDSTEIAYTVHKLNIQFQVNSCGIDVINGEGVVSTLQRVQTNYEIVPVRGNAACTNRYWEEHDAKSKDLFLNLRAEMYHVLAKKIYNTYQFYSGIRQYDQTELISFNCENIELLFSQLETIERMNRTDGKIRIMSKQEMKENGIDSPDRADSLYYALAALELGNYRYG